MLASQLNLESKYDLDMFSSRLYRLLFATCFGIMASLFFSQAQAASPLRIASWNLGWHVSQAALPAWIDFCNRTFERDSQGVWRVSTVGNSSNAKRGWDITENRARFEGADMASMPPCGVYRGKRNEPVAVTAAAYVKRNDQLARFFSNQIKADVIALQEVSGISAAREALGAQAEEYDFCGFDGRFKVQRLVIAWRKTRASAAGPCTMHESLSLPHLPTDKQVRPGLSIVLKIDDQLIRFFTVHLKSSCVSALNATGKRRGHLERRIDDQDPCPILQEQIAPLETIFEALADSVDGFIALGDFNRNLWHEFNAADNAVRTDGSDPTGKREANTKTINMLREINDGVPAQSRAHLVKFGCHFDPEAAQLCDFAASVALRADEQSRLTQNKGLGCRNGIGLDHMLISQRWEKNIIEAEKLPIGRLGNTLAANAQYPDPLLGVSDHCPILLSLKLR
jgi:exonuclease III